ncbi:MAG: phage tail protein, partial [Pseudomonas sp.]
MMLALGMFVFSLSTAAYQELQRQTEWRHASNNRIGAVPARQFLGRGDDTITLPGVILPVLAGGGLRGDAIRWMAISGKAWRLVEGSGRIYGVWV